MKYQPTQRPHKRETCVEEPLGVSQMALTLLAERREPSGEWPLNDAKPAGWRPSATETQSKVSIIGR